MGLAVEQSCSSDWWWEDDDDDTWTSPGSIGSSRGVSVKISLDHRIPLSSGGRDGGIRERKKWFWTGYKPKKIPRRVEDEWGALRLICLVGVVLA